MSVLVLGGDRIAPIRELLLSMGVETIIHWTERGEKKRRQKNRTLPKNISMVIMLTNFLNHNSMKYFKSEAKARGIPIVFTTRNADCVKNAFIQTLYTLDKDSKICNACDKYLECYPKEQ